MSRDGTLVIELAGLPGSGKTTLASGLARRLTQDGLSCSVADLDVSARSGRLARTRRRATYSALEVARHPAASLRATQLLLSSAQARRADSAKLVMQWLATGHLLAAAHARPGVQLLEEGAAQTIWTALLRAGRLEASELWECLPRQAHGHVQLFVDVSPEVAADRLVRRRSRHSRTQLLPHAERLAELHRGRDLFDQVIGSSPLPVLRVLGDGLTGAQVVEAAREAVVNLPRLR
jgi:thymidylate kinase